MKRERSRSRSTASRRIAQGGYFSGDSHLHFRRQDAADDQKIFDLLEAEDIHFASILAYNEPAGPYAGIMQTLAAPQFRGLGTNSLRERGDYHILSGQEYRSATYGHLNLYFRNDLVLPDKRVDANNGPLYGVVARNTRPRVALPSTVTAVTPRPILTRRFMPTPFRGTLMALSFCNSGFIASWDLPTGTGF